SDVRRVDAETQAQKVLAYFESTGNTPATVRQIGDATGLTKNAVNALLRNSGQRHLFFPIRIGPKRILWRMRLEDDDEGGVVDDPEIVAGFEAANGGDD